MRARKQLSNIVGRQFGNWIVIREKGLSKHLKVRLECRCKCGFVSDRDMSSLTSGKTKSCGCLKCGKPASERMFVQHGMSRTPEMNTWSGMLNRCNAPRHRHYEGRKIRVCNFLSMSPHNLVSLIGMRPPCMRPRQWSVDRIDVNGNYSCGTCTECVENGWGKNIRWATQLQQTRNTTRNRMITIGSETHCMSEWAEKTGVPIQTIWSRLKRGYAGTILLEKRIR